MTLARCFFYSLPATHYSLLIWLSRRPLPPNAATGLPIGSRLKNITHASQ
jgi:hypothetical protein